MAARLLQPPLAKVLELTCRACRPAVADRLAFHRMTLAGIILAISASAFHVALPSPHSHTQSRSCSRRVPYPASLTPGRGVETDLTPGEDLYLIVGVPRTASDADIRAAYRQRARMIHPDVSSAADAPREFRRLSAATEVLLSSRRDGWHSELGVAADWPMDMDMNGPQQAASGSSSSASDGSGSWVSDIRKVRKWGPIWSAIIGPWLSWYVFVALDTFVR